MPDASYLMWVRSQPCACQPCILRSQAHHPTNGETERHSKSLGGRRGLGQKAADVHAFPLCLKHHDELHDGHGFFEDMEQAARRAWQDEQSTKCRAAYDAEIDADRVAKENPTAEAPPVADPPWDVTRELAEGLDPKRISRRFAKFYGLSGQSALDLERLLQAFMSAGSRHQRRTG